MLRTFADCRRSNHTKDPILRLIYEKDEPEDDSPQETPLSRVYAILDAEACQVKIGFTYDIQRRLDELSKDRGRRLEIVGTMVGGYDLERAMHGRFRAHRREGREWYSTEILAELLPLLDAA